MRMSNLYTSSEHQKNMSHFADIVKLAAVDGIDDKEYALLNRLALILNLSEDEKKEVLEDPGKYNTKLALNAENRIKYLYNLTRMLLVDGQVSEQGLLIIKRVCAGLGFSVEKVDAIVERAIDMFLRIPDVDEFSDEIKEVM